MLENVFKTSSKQMKQNNAINDATLKIIKLEFNKEICSRSFIMQAYKNGFFKEYALSAKSM
eukprot:13129282-Ditylum_brightwellii.AAC.1